MQETKAVEVPDGNELFESEVILGVDSEVDRYLRKPSGTSDQGYSED